MPHGFCRVLPALISRPLKSCLITDIQYIILKIPLINLQVFLSLQ